MRRNLDPGTPGCGFEAGGFPTEGLTPFLKRLSDAVCVVAVVVEGDDVNECCDVLALSPSTLFSRRRNVSARGTDASFTIMTRVGVSCRRRRRRRLSSSSASSSVSNDALQVGWTSIWKFQWSMISHPGASTLLYNKFLLNLRLIRDFIEIKPGSFRRKIPRKIVVPILGKSSPVPGFEPPTTFASLSAVNADLQSSQLDRQKFSVFGRSRSRKSFGKSFVFVSAASLESHRSPWR